MEGGRDMRTGREGGGGEEKQKGEGNGIKNKGLKKIKERRKKEFFAHFRF